MMTEMGIGFRASWRTPKNEKGRPFSRPFNLIPDLTQLVTTLKTEPRRPRRPRRKYFLWTSWLSFLPDHALDSILNARDFPVKEEADGTSAQLEIGKQLGSMDGMDRINSFVFDEYAFINQEIGPISTITLSNCPAAEGANIFFLCGLRGSIYKDQSTAFIHRP